MVDGQSTNEDTAFPWWYRSVTLDRRTCFFWTVELAVTSCSNTLFFVTTFRGQVPCGDSSYPFGIFETLQTFHLTLQVSCYVCLHVFTCPMAQSSPRRLTFSFIFDLVCDRERSLSRSPSHSVHLHFHHRLNPGYPGKVKRTFELRTAIVTRKPLSGIILILNVAESSPMGHLSAVSGTRESECFEARMLWFRNWDCLQSPWSDLDDQQLALLEVMLDRFLIYMSASAGRLMFPICFRRCPVCQLEFCRSTNPRHHIAPCFRPAHHQGRCLCDEHLDSLS